LLYPYEGRILLTIQADCYDEPADVLDIVSNWLSTCSDSHELCRSRDADGALPTRLISITAEPARLVQTSELPKRPQYATLSHCWGSQQFIKLTTKTIDSFMKHLPVEILPNTFKDALRVTKRLGLDFIWIDSLCIIQDDDDDWQNEAALMSSVYHSSIINIAASSAHDGSQGCFLKPPLFSGGLRARINEGSGQRVRDFRSKDVYHISTFGTHLGTRAWALQEKLLPPRTIHFSNRGAFWECRTTIASEYLLDEIPGLVGSKLVCQRGDFEWLWHPIVRIYSGANLTFGKDKLVALAGIARLGHIETGDQYLAGLWRSRIEEQLCWYRCTSAPGVRPPWRAPTWSWASIDGQVSWQQTQPGVLETSYAHVLDASTRYEYDPFGQVTSGVIRLACSTMVIGNFVRLEQFDGTESDEGTRVVLLSGSEEQDFPIQIDCIRDGYKEGDGQIYLLPLLGGSTGSRTKEKGKDWFVELKVQGLVLQATGATRGEFSRVGSFQFYNTRKHYDPFLRVLKEQGRATAEATCAETISSPQQPGEQYIITLI
jgi:hypothetical protein